MTPEQFDSALTSDYMSSNTDVDCIIDDISHKLLPYERQMLIDMIKGRFKENYLYSTQQHIDPETGEPLCQKETDR